MKFLLLLAMCVFAGGSFAHEHEMEGKTFEDKKQIMTSYIEKKLDVLQSSKTCVNKATDESALKKCKEQMKESMKGMKKHKKK